MTYTDCDYIRGNHHHAVIMNSMPKQNFGDHKLKDDCKVERYLTRWLKYTGHKLLSIGNKKANPTI